MILKKYIFAIMIHLSRYEVAFPWFCPKQQLFHAGLLCPQLKLQTKSRSVVYFEAIDLVHNSRIDRSLLPLTLAGFTFFSTKSLTTFSMQV